jgi:hypothetical protein
MPAGRSTREQNLDRAADIDDPVFRDEGGADFLRNAIFPLFPAQALGIPRNGQIKGD